MVKLEIFYNMLKKITIHHHLLKIIFQSLRLYALNFYIKQFNVRTGLTQHESEKINLLTAINLLH